MRGRGVSAEMAVELTEGARAWLGAAESGCGWLVWAGGWHPGRREVCAEDGQGVIGQTRDLVAASLRVGEDLVEDNRCHATGVGGTVAAFEGEGTDAAVCDDQVFLVLPAVVSEADLELDVVGQTSELYPFDREVLYTPAAVEVVVLRVGRKPSSACGKCRTQVRQPLQVCGRADYPG